MECVFHSWVQPLYWRAVLLMTDLHPDHPDVPYPHLPTGLEALDRAITGDTQKCPGLPRGRITHLWGPDSPGAVHEIVTQTAAKSKVLVVRSEKSPYWAGAPIEEFILPERGTLDAFEETWTHALFAVARHQVDLLILDPISNCVGYQIPQLKIMLRKTNTAMLVRSDAEQTGGKVWQFCSAVRIECPRPTLYANWRFRVCKNMMSMSVGEEWFERRDGSLGCTRD